MKDIIFVLCILGLTKALWCQTEKHGSIKAGSITLDYAFLSEEKTPLHFSSEDVFVAIFPGGLDSLYSYAKSKLYYPKTAVQDSLEGRVEVFFTVNKQGVVEDIELNKSVRVDLDTICINMVRDMPKWTPSKLEGKWIATRFLLPIIFLRSNEQE